MKVYPATRDDAKLVKRLARRFISVAKRNRYLAGAVDAVRAIMDDLESGVDTFAVAHARVKLHEAIDLYNRFDISTRQARLALQLRGALAITFMNYDDYANVTPNDLFEYIARYGRCFRNHGKFAEIKHYLLETPDILLAYYKYWQADACVRNIFDEAHIRAIFNWLFYREANGTLSTVMGRNGLFIE